MADVLPSDELTDEPSDFGALRPGTRLGRYELLVPIARGGMARVWAARQHGQRGFQKLVAIKTILPHLAEEPEFERMFLDEARIASRVHHPNVCEIYELGEERRTLYLAMEWATGDSMSRVLRASGKTEALDPRVVARVVADACAGVHAAHELTDDDGTPLGVVHRDMSPHNVLLTADGVAKVCDFGVAKALGQLHEQTSAGQMKGKISYMSPEQVTGAEIDRRSDVFSLGCVLYEATTGVRPFRGERDHMIMHAILSGEVEPPTRVVRGYPPELERIVLRALAHKPILRYPTAERMRFALEEFLARGQLVTQSNVAQAVRARLGDQLERRKERIRQASSVAEHGGWDPSSVAPTRDAVDHRSGVQQARPSPVTVQMPPAPESAIAAASRGRDAQSSADLLPGLPGDEYAQPMSPRASSPSVPPAPPAAEGPPNPSGAPTFTLPIGPGAMVSPFAGAPPPWEARSDHSRSGREGSHPSFTPLPGGPTHTLPPASSQPSNAYATTRLYDVAGALPAGLAEEPRKEAGAGQYALAALAGLLVAVVIGVAGFFLWRHQAASPDTPVVVAEAPPSAAAPAPPASPEIALHVTPADAVLVIEGKELAADVRAVPRPEPGRAVTVVVHANGYADKSVDLDASTAGPVDVVLEPAIEIDDVPAASTEPPPEEASSAGKPRPKPRPRDPTVLPDNPY